MRKLPDYYYSPDPIISCCKNGNQGDQIKKNALKNYVFWDVTPDRVCGLVFRVSGYRSRGPGFDSRPYQIF
jgi:hypothetical protein